MPDLDPDLRALQEVRDLVERASAAQQAVARCSQGEIDAICRAMAEAGARAAHDLARAAVDETGIGRVHYKILKNLFGSEGTWASIAEEKTVGVIHRDEARGVLEVATPAGVIAGIVPTTNPTSTALNKALISVKGRNAIVISPHPRARRCIGETVEVLRRAIERAGGPPDLVASLSNPTIESTGALMKHRKVALILATGGSGLVEAAYSSGKPAYGVGPGNVPVYVDRSADLVDAARWIVASQGFDNGTLCCSEQGLVLDRPIAEKMLAELKRRGAHLCSDEEADKLARRCNVRGHMCPDVVGKDPHVVAEMSGFTVPRTTSLLLAHQGGVGREWPLSIEILCPLLSVHVVDGWEEGCDVSMRTLRYGGLGHTIGLWARDQEVLDAWFLEKPANRIVVNGPTSEGAVGYSTNLVPSMSLGCGPQAGNITSDNITARHLINIKRVAFRRRDWETVYAADHARAARFSGDAAPRGSGLPGDPSLEGATPAVARAAPRAPAPATSGTLTTTGTGTEPPGLVRSNWRGNPPTTVQGRSAEAAGRAPAPQAAGERRAPRFTQPRPGATGATGATAVLEPSVARPPRAPSPAARAAPPATATPSPGPYIGMSLSPREIEGILAHAGQGCPLGPCHGCPHNDVTTGACMA